MTHHPLVLVFNDLLGQAGTKTSPSLINKDAGNIGFVVTSLMVSYF